jgi:hypothetical protein
MLTNFHFHQKLQNINYNFICDMNYIIDNICNICVGNYYLVDSGYPNKKGFFHQYNEEKYHLRSFNKVPVGV